MTVAELMSAADIVSYVEDYGVELEYKNGEYWGLSPLKEEKTPSFAINEDKQTFYDFSTGKGGNILTLIRELYSCTLQEAIKKLKEYTGIDDNCETFIKVPSIVRIAKHY
ncbi:MAG: CHC2 zinc finger domain-containing protein, partial [Ruminiclostridium sp.]